MINYSFVCQTGHEFSVHFNNANSCEKQLQQNIVQCPYCNDNQVQKLLSAPNVQAKKNSKKNTSNVASEPDDKEIRAMWKKLYAHIKTEFDNVGEDFADEARKIHYGKTKQRKIYGKADYQEVQALNEEGVKILPLPMMEENKKH